MKTNKPIKNPLVSIVTPAYNEEQFLPDNLHSIIKQNYTNIEHIVVNDGSSDGTEEVLREFESKYNLRWVTQSNKGLAPAVNQGFEMAKGDIVVWLNADDLLFKRDTITRVVNAFQRTGTDFLYGSYARVDKENRIQRVDVPFPKFSLSRLHRVCFGAFIFFRKYIIDEYRLDSSYDHTPDYDLYLRAANDGWDFNYIDEILFGHRRYENTKTISQSGEMQSESRRCQREHGQEFDWEYRIDRAVDLGMLRLLMLWGGVQLIRSIRQPEKLAFEMPSENPYRAVFRHFYSIPPSLLAKLFP